MTKLGERPHSLIENYDLLRNILSASGPTELQLMRETAMRAFEAVGLPTTRDEEFKYLSLRSLEETRFVPAYGATVERSTLAKMTLGKIDAITVTFVNGEYAPELSTADVLPDGVFIGSLADGFESHAETILVHLGAHASLEGKLGSTNDERFVRLNTAFIGEGAFVYVPKGVFVERTIHINYVNQADHGTFAAHPRSLIVLEEAAQAKVLESFVGLEGSYLTNAVTELVVGKNAILEHTKYQSETAGSFHIANVSATQATGSTLTSNNVNFGGKIVRNDINVYIAGEHTETWLNGANVGLGDQVVDNHTRIDHAKANCISFEVYKSILGDRSTGIFNGKIFVYEDAQKTDAKQTNQGLLLSPNATFNTKPQLEIFADDVKCTHGATVGQLREDALFYLRARGIPYAEARALLVYAFAAESLDKISIPDVREVLEAELFEILQRSAEKSRATEA